MRLCAYLQEAIPRLERKPTAWDLHCETRARSCPRICISHISKEVRDMAETIATLVVGGLILAVSTGMAYLVIYLFGNNGKR